MQDILGWAKVILDMFGVTDAIKVVLYVLVGLFVYHRFFGKD